MEIIYGKKKKKKNTLIYVKDGRSVENDSVTPGELLENHNSETQEQTPFGWRSLERSHDRNTFPLGLRNIRAHL